MKFSLEFNQTTPNYAEPAFLKPETASFSEITTKCLGIIDEHAFWNMLQVCHWAEEANMVSISIGYANHLLVIEQVNGSTKTAAGPPDGIKLTSKCTPVCVCVSVSKCDFSQQQPVNYPI